MAISIPRKAIYLVLAWVLMVSYQIFTHSALITLASSLKNSIPTLASLITSNLDLTVFICSFAWMFVLSALIQTVMFGKERRLTIQFLVSLALTLVGSALLGLLNIVGLGFTNPSILSQPFAFLFGNIFFAFFLPCFALYFYGGS